MSVSEVVSRGTTGGLVTGAKGRVGVYVGDVEGAPVGDSVGEADGARDMEGVSVGFRVGWGEVGDCVMVGPKVLIPVGAKDGPSDGGLVIVGAVVPEKSKSCWLCADDDFETTPEANKDATTLAIPKAMIAATPAIKAIFRFLSIPS